MDLGLIISLITLVGLLLQCFRLTPEWIATTKAVSEEPTIETVKPLEHHVQEATTVPSKPVNATSLESDNPGNYANYYSPYNVTNATWVNQEFMRSEHVATAATYAVTIFAVLFVIATFQWCCNVIRRRFLKRTNVVRPQVFEEGMDVENWLKGFEDYCSAIGVNASNTRAQMLLDSMSTKTRALLKNVVTTVYGNKAQYNQTKMLFKQMFQAQCVTTRAYRLQFLNRFQRNGESMERYYAELVDLACKGYPNAALTERVEYVGEQFLHGLADPRAKEAIALASIENGAAAQHLLCTATKFEALKNITARVEQLAPRTNNLTVLAERESDAIAASEYTVLATTEPHVNYVKTHHQRKDLNNNNMDTYVVRADDIETCNQLLTSTPFVQSDRVPRPKVQVVDEPTPATAGVATQPHSMQRHQPQKPETHTPLGAFVARQTNAVDVVPINQASSKKGEEIRGKCLVNGVLVDYLVDTGCNQTIMNKNVADQIEGSKCLSFPVRVTTADGKLMEIAGLQRCIVEIGDTKCETDIIISPELQQSMLLSMDILNKNEITQPFVAGLQETLNKASAAVQSKVLQRTTINGTCSQKEVQINKVATEIVENEQIGDSVKVNSVHASPSVVSGRPDRH
jgi:gag-polyprotein putative aspartyl protease